MRQYNLAEEAVCLTRAQSCVTQGPWPPTKRHTGKAHQCGATCSTVIIVQICCPQRKASYKLTRQVGSADATVQLDSRTAVWRAARWEMRHLPAQRSITTVKDMRNLQWRCTKDIIQCLILSCTMGLAHGPACLQCTGCGSILGATPQ